MRLKLPKPDQQHLTANRLRKTSRFFIAYNLPKMFKIFRTPNFTDVVEKQLETAKLNLLDAESTFEMAAARLQMARTTVTRLSNHPAIATAVARKEEK